MELKRKCILLVRVSTDAQDLAQQTDKVKSQALSDGYTEDSIIVIEDKESAVKLSEEERNCLNRLKMLIDNDPLIDCEQKIHVFFFHVIKILIIHCKDKQIFIICYILRQHD